MIRYSLSANGGEHYSVYMYDGLHIYILYYGGNLFFSCEKIQDQREKTYGSDGADDRTGTEDI